jgi:putative hydrolase of HD superfamily
VKRAVKGLDLLIKDIESKQVEEQILPLVPPELHSEIRYFTEDEFRSKIKVDGIIQTVTSEAITSMYNDSALDPLDGEILRACDQLAAYLEAAISLEHGIRSNHIVAAFNALKKDNQHTVVGGIDFGALYALY